MPECRCPTCTVTRCLRELDVATNVWLERETESNMTLHWLVDEVERFLTRPWTYRRLRKTFRSVKRDLKLASELE